MKDSILWKVTGVCVSQGPAPVGSAAHLLALCYCWESFSYGFLSGSESTGTCPPGGQPVLKLPQTAHIKFCPGGNLPPLAPAGAESSLSLPRLRLTILS